MTRSPAKVFVFPLLFFISAAGCAVNQWGCVKVVPFENRCAYITELEAWGVHLSTRSADAGITIGHAKKTYVIKKRNPPGVPSTEPIVFDRLEPAGRFPAQETWKDTIAVIDAIRGIRFFFNSWRGVGVAAGLCSHAALRLPKGFSGVMFMNIDSLDSGLHSIAIKENTQ